MNPKYKRVAERIKDLITEVHSVAALERPSEYVGPYIQDKVPLHTWLDIVLYKYRVSQPHKSGNDIKLTQKLFLSLGNSVKKHINHKSMRNAEVMTKGIISATLH